MVQRPSAIANRTSIAQDFISQSLLRFSSNHHNQTRHCTSMKRSLEIERGEETHQAKRRCIENLEQELTDMEHQHQALNHQNASPQQYVELTDHQQQGTAEMELQVEQTDAPSVMSTDDTQLSSDGSYTDSDSCDNSIESDGNTDDTEPQANELHDGEENLVHWKKSQQYVPTIRHLT